MLRVETLKRDTRKRQKISFIISASICFGSGQGNVDQCCQEPFKDSLATSPCNFQGGGI